MSLVIVLVLVVKVVAVTGSHNHSLKRHLELTIDWKFGPPVFLGPPVVLLSITRLAPQW